MKFIFVINAKAIICISLLLALVFCNTNSNLLKNKEKLKTKTRNNMDYLHYISNFNQNNEDASNEKSSDSSNFKFKSTNKNGMIFDPRKTFKYPIAADEILEGWFIIASEEFHNVKRFPPIKTADGKVKLIETNGLNFRINHAMNCTDAAKPEDERQFYFRLTNNSLFYSATKTDLNVLGYITIKEISDILGNVDISGLKEYFCFDTKDELFKEWKLCSDNKLVTEKWYCVIKKYLGKAENEDLCWGIPQDEGTNYHEKIIKKPIIMVPLPSPTCNDNWTYDRNGDDWVCDCKDGAEQSPINLPFVTGAIESPVKPIFSYKDVTAINEHSTLEGVLENQHKLKIMNIDNMIKIIHYDMGKITTVDGAVYNAQEITFHTPSNHQIDGVSYPLEVSIIHYGVTKGDIGKQVVLSFLFKAEPGVYNKFLEDLDYFNLPNSVTKKRGLTKSLFIPNFLYEENDFNTEVPIMKPFSFYTYSGSLPFPPCTERTIHYVASKPLRVSTTTIALFKEALRMPDLKSKTGEIFSFSKERVSNRNIQNTNGRPVYWYDHQKHCGPDPVPVKPKKSGHFEKVVAHGTQYFYVGGPEPSGLPGAFVVSEKEAKGSASQI